MIPKPLANGIIVVITILMAVNFLAVFFVEGYEADPIIYGIFMAIVGGAFGLRRHEQTQRGRASQNGPT